MTVDNAAWTGLADALLSATRPSEGLVVELAAESSLFVRCSGAKVRQSGVVDDADLRVTLYLQARDGVRRATRTQTLTGDAATDLDRAQATLLALRSEIPHLPVDPYAELPTSAQVSHTESAGCLPGHDEAVDAVLGPACDLDLAGLYAGGTMVRAAATSAAARHWFATTSYTLDYSLYTDGKRALKGTMAGARWDAALWRERLVDDRERLLALRRPAVRLDRGDYRAWLAPAAVADLVGMLSWDAIGEGSIQQGVSPLRSLRTGDRSLSPLFSLAEAFDGNNMPRFDDQGELAPERQDLIRSGRLVGTLVNTRSAREYSVPCTGANTSESLRSALVAGGSLTEAGVLGRLDSGLWLSNLHYLNWSDHPAGRMTGMTRYACFLVRGGELVAPIEAMRWDDSLFSLFGDNLVDCGAEPALIAETGSYGMRQHGGSRVPGMLLARFRLV